jgi:hypothetical protein
MTDDPARVEIGKVFEKVDLDLYEAVATVELLRHPTYDQKFLERFRKTYAAHGLNMVRRSLLQQGVICLSRLWDPAKDAQSIPRLAALVADEKNMARVRARRREDMLSLPDEVERGRGTPLEPIAHAALTTIAYSDAESAAAKADHQAEQVKELIANREFQGLRDSAINWRHKIAHPVEETRMERKAKAEGTTVEPLKWGDLEKAVAYSCDVASALALLGLDLNTSYPSRQEVWASYADAFWLGYGELPR